MRRRDFFKKRCHGSKLEQGSRERERHRGGWMRSSNNKILTTHAGSLSRPPNLIALSRARAVGENEDKAAYATCLTGAVADVVRKQRALGIDIPDDGEFGKPVAGSYDYGAWWNYAFARMSGFSPAGSPQAAAHETQHKKSSVADLAVTSFANRRDWQKFSEFYLDPESSGSLMGSAARRPVGRPACTGPIKYTGHAALHADIANLGSRLIKSTIPGRLQDRRTPSSSGPTCRIVWRCA